MSSSGRAPASRLRSVTPVAAALAASAILGAGGGGGTATAAATPPVMRVAALAGPIAIHGGSRPAAVARLPLGPGSWTVMVKGVIRSRSASPGVRPVRCRLVRAGSGAEVLAAPAPRGRPGSNQAFLAVHAWHLDAPGRVTLACAAPGSATGALVVERLRAVAFRTDALTIDRAGASTVHGDPGDESAAQLLAAPDVRLSMDLTLVTSMALPAGAWAVTATASAEQRSDRSAELYCEIAPGDGGRAGATLGRSTAPGGRLPLAMAMVLQQATPITLWFTCSDRPSGIDPWIRDVRIAAYRVTTLDSRVLDPDATYPPAGAAPDPVVDAGHDLAARPIPAGTSWTSIHRLVLPPGRWVVVSQGRLARSGEGAATVSCRTGRGATFDRLDARLAAQGPSAAQPLVGIWTGTLASAGAVALQCRSSGPGTSLEHVSIVAYRAGTLAAVRLR